MDPTVEDAEPELHEIERWFDRAAGMFEGASPELAREMVEVRERIRLARWRVAMERTMRRALTAA
jgi:hypothetical protein